MYPQFSYKSVNHWEGQSHFGSSKSELRSFGSPLGPPHVRPWKKVPSIVMKCEKFSDSVEKWQNGRKLLKSLISPSFQRFGTENVAIRHGFEMKMLKTLQKPLFAAFLSGVNLGGGVPPNFFGFYVPLPPMFYCIFEKDLSEIFEIWSFMSRIFFWKISQNFPKISWNFVDILKVEKNLLFLYPDSFKITKLMKIWSNFPKKLLSNSRIFFKILHFSKFSAPSAPKIWSFMLQNPIVFGVRVPLGPGSPLIYLWFLSTNFSKISEKTLKNF